MDYDGGLSERVNLEAARFHFEDEDEDEDEDSSSDDEDGDDNSYYSDHDGDCSDDADSNEDLSVDDLLDEDRLDEDEDRLDEDRLKEDLVEEDHVGDSLPVRNDDKNQSSDDKHAVVVELLSSSSSDEEESSGKRKADDADSAIDLTKDEESRMASNDCDVVSSLSISDAQARSAKRRARSTSTSTLDPRKRKADNVDSAIDLTNAEESRKTSFAHPQRKSHTAFAASRVFAASPPRHNDADSDLQQAIQLSLKSYLHHRENGQMCSTDCVDGRPIAKVSSFLVRAIHEIFLACTDVPPTRISQVSPDILDALRSLNEGIDNTTDSLDTRSELTHLHRRRRATLAGIIPGSPSEDGSVLCSKYVDSSSYLESRTLRCNYEFDDHDLDSNGKQSPRP